MPSLGKLYTDDDTNDDDDNDNNMKGAITLKPPYNFSYLYQSGIISAG